MDSARNGNGDSRVQCSWAFLYTGLKMVPVSGAFLEFEMDKDEAELLSKASLKKKDVEMGVASAAVTTAPQREVIDHRWFIDCNLQNKMKMECRRWLLEAAKNAGSSIVLDEATARDLISLQSPNLLGHQVPDGLASATLEFLFASRAATIVRCLEQSENAYNHLSLRSVTDRCLANSWKAGSPGPIEILLLYHYAAKPELESVPEVKRNLALARELKWTQRRDLESAVRAEIAASDKAECSQAKILEDIAVIPAEYIGVGEKKKLVTRLLSKKGQQSAVLPATLSEREAVIAAAAKVAKVSKEEFEKNIKRKLNAAHSKGKRARFSTNQNTAAHLLSGGSTAPITHYRELAAQDAARQVAFVNVKVADPPDDDCIAAFRFYCIHNLRGMGNPFDLNLPRQKCELLRQRDQDQDEWFEGERVLAEAIVAANVPRRSKGCRQQHGKIQQRANNLGDIVTGAQQNALVDLQREMGAWRLPSIRKWLAWDIWPLGGPGWLRHDAAGNVVVVANGFLTSDEKVTFDSFMSHALVEGKPTNALISAVCLIGYAKELFAGEGEEADPLGLSLLPEELGICIQQSKWDEARQLFLQFRSDPSREAVEWRTRFLKYSMPWLKKGMGRKFFMQFVCEVAHDADKHVLSRPADRDALYAKSKMARNINLGTLLLLTTDAAFYPTVFAQHLCSKDESEKTLCYKFAALRDSITGRLPLIKPSQ